MRLLQQHRSRRLNDAFSQSCCHHGGDVRYLPAHIYDRVWIMVSKLKQRRVRRLKADVAWWRDEAEDCRSRLLELAGEIDRLRALVIRVPMPVLVPESVADELKLREVG